MELRFLFLHSEVDGFPISQKGEHRRKPKVIKLTWALFNQRGQLIEHRDSLFSRSEGILNETKKRTNLSNNILNKHGKDRNKVLFELLSVMETVDHVVSYNLNYELGVLKFELGKDEVMRSIKFAQEHCLMNQSRIREVHYDHVRDYYMSLEELYHSLFHKEMSLKRTPLSQIGVMAHCFFELNSKRKWIKDQH